MTRRGSRQRGFALLIVLWTLALLALLGAHLLAASRQDAQLARNMVDAALLEAAARGAVQQAIFGVLDGSTGHWHSDGTVHRLRLDGAVVDVRVNNEADKVNPNIASPALLQALLLQVGADPASAAANAAAIVQWRLANAGPGRSNATIARYVAAGREFAPSGEPFESLDELGEVMGMTPTLLARLRPHLTLFTDGDPDANTRDPVVARALVAVGELNGGEDNAGEELVAVTAEARGRGRGHFAIQAVVRTNANPDGRRYEILAYRRLWD